MNAKQAIQSGSTADHGDLLAAIVIELYPLLHTALLSLLALITWVSSSWESFLQLLPGSYPADSANGLVEFGSFQNVMIAAACAGLGGGVFMIREFYLKYSYGNRGFLKRAEIARFTFLPFSSVILGPIGLSMLKGVRSPSRGSQGREYRLSPSSSPASFWASRTMTP